MKKNQKSLVRVLKQVAAKSIKTGEKSCTLEEVDGAFLSELEKLGFLRRVASGKIALTPDGASFLKRVQCLGEDAFLTQHRQISHEKTGDGDPVQVNLAESPLSRLYMKKGKAGKRLINQAQFTAGERLRRDFERAQFSPKLGMSLTPKVDMSRHEGGHGDAMDAAIGARRRLNAALDYVGAEMGSLLLDICCFLKGLERVERERQWPVRSAKVVLALALTRLASHYGLSNEARGRDAAYGSLVSWHMDSG